MKYFFIIFYYYHRYRHCCCSYERINKIVIKTVTVSKSQIRGNFFLDY